MAPAALLLAVAHLAIDEAGAVLVLRLHYAATGALPADEASLAALSRMGKAWFRRPDGSEESRGARVMAALRQCGVAIAAAPAAAAPAPESPAAAGKRDLTPREVEQRRAAVQSRWSVVRGSGQLPLPVDPPAAEPRPGPVPVAPAAARAAPAPPRPDREEIPDELALDYVRGWLYQYAGRASVPDMATCRNVLAAARGASMWDLYAVLNELFERRVRVGRTWGWFVACVRNHFSGAMPAAGTAVG